MCLDDALVWGTLPRFGNQTPPPWMAIVPPNAASAAFPASCCPSVCFQQTLKRLWWSRCPGVGTSSCGLQDQGLSIKRRIVNGWPMQLPSWGCCWMKLEMSPLKPQKKCVLKMICLYHWRKMKIRVLETPLRDLTLRYESLRRSLGWLAWECWSWIDSLWSSQKCKCLRSRLLSPMVICCPAKLKSGLNIVHQGQGMVLPSPKCVIYCSVWTTLAFVQKWNKAQPPKWCNSGKITIKLLDFWPPHFQTNLGTCAVNLRILRRPELIFALEACT